MSQVVMNQLSSPQYDYLNTLQELFDRFIEEKEEENGKKMGRPPEYKEVAFIILFVILQARRIFTFKAQRRWLLNHLEIMVWLGWTKVPHRTTFSRRYKKLYAVLTDFILFIGQNGPNLICQTALRVPLGDSRRKFTTAACRKFWQRRARGQKRVRSLAERS